MRRNKPMRTLSLLNNPPTSPPHKVHSSSSMQQWHLQQRSVGRMYKAGGQIDLRHHHLEMQRRREVSFVFLMMGELFVAINYYYYLNCIIVSLL